MSSITITTLFTKNAGEPATGLTLSDIDIYLNSRAKATGVVVAVWTGENPTEEIGGGLYTKRYVLANEDLYEYFCWAEYTGAVSLDSDYAVQITPGSSVGEVATAVWAYSTRTLTQAISALVATLVGTAITIKRGDSFSVPFTGLGDISGRSKLWFTVKRGKHDSDAESIIQTEESAGLLRLNGADASARSGNGSITVTDENTGDLTIALDEAETDDLTTQRLHYDIQMLTAGGTVTTLGYGSCVVIPDITRSIT